MDLNKRFLDASEKSSSRKHQYISTTRHRWTSRNILILNRGIFEVLQLSGTHLNEFEIHVKDQWWIIGPPILQGWPD